MSATTQQEACVLSDADASGLSPLPAREWLTLRRGAEEYGIDILCVQEIRSQGGQISGAMFDSLSDVLNFEVGEVKAFPEMPSAFEGRFITGIGSVRHDDVQHMPILLDIATLIASMHIGAGALAASDHDMAAA